MTLQANWMTPNSYSALFKFFHQLCNIVDPVYGLLMMHIKYNFEGLDL